MAKQLIDTDRVLSAANKLRTINTTINDEFRSLQNTAKCLDNDWKSRASNVSQTTREKVFNNNEVRSSVIQNYINILEQQVAPGYVETETVNSKLAEKFK